MTANPNAALNDTVLAVRYDDVAEAADRIRDLVVETPLI